jgi:hypothetical protein
VAGREETSVGQLGRLFNSEGEVIAEGTCELKPPALGGREVTMRVSSERVRMERQQGPMTLILEDGATLEIDAKLRLKFRVNGSAGDSSFIYKLRAVEQPRLEPQLQPAKEESRSAGL